MLYNNAFQLVWSVGAAVAFMLSLFVISELGFGRNSSGKAKVWLGPLMMLLSIALSWVFVISQVVLYRWWVNRRHRPAAARIRSY